MKEDRGMLNEVNEALVEASESSIIVPFLSARDIQENFRM